MTWNNLKQLARRHGPAVADVLAAGRIVMAFGVVVLVWLSSPAIVAFGHRFAAASYEAQVYAVSLGVVLVAVIWAAVWLIRRTPRHRRRDVVSTSPAAALATARMDDRRDLMPAGLQRAWSRLAREYGGDFATWVCATLPADATEDQAMVRGIAHYHQWARTRGEAPLARSLARHEAAHAIVAHAQGCTVVRVNIRTSGHRGGYCEWQLPLQDLTTSDRVWIRLLIALAGQTIDHLDGHHDVGASDDLATVQNAALTIIAAGIRPEGHGGPLTLDALITSARREVARILNERAGAIDALAAELGEHTELGPHQVRDTLDPGNMVGPELPQRARPVLVDIEAMTEQPHAEGQRR